MSNKRLLVAVALGIGAGVAHFAYVSSLRGELGGGQPVDILAYAASVEAGVVVEQRHLATRAIPEAYLDDRFVRASESEDVIGLATSLDVEGGAIVSWSDFRQRLKSMDDDLAGLVEAGERAVTIPVDRALSMGGMLRPGHRVDILGTFARGEQRKDRVTVTLLQNVKVLATGRDLSAKGEDGGAARFSTVTLSVDVEEAELLALATSQGSLSLALRGPQDLAVVNGVPEKEMQDVFDPSQRQAPSNRARDRQLPSAIERLKAR